MATENQRPPKPTTAGPDMADLPSWAQPPPGWSPSEDPQLEHSLGLEESDSSGPSTGESGRTSHATLSELWDGLTHVRYLAILVKGGLDGSVKQPSQAVNLRLCERIVEVCDKVLRTPPVRPFPSEAELDRVRDTEDHSVGDYDDEG